MAPRKLFTVFADEPTMATSRPTSGVLQPRPFDGKVPFEPASPDPPKKKKSVFTASVYEPLPDDAPCPPAPRLPHCERFGGEQSSSERFGAERFRSERFGDDENTPPRELASVPMERTGMQFRADKAKGLAAAPLAEVTEAYTGQQGAWGGGSPKRPRDLVQSGSSGSLATKRRRKPAPSRPGMRI